MLFRLPGVQAQQPVFKQVSIPKGAHWGYISALAQDEQGLLWLATHNGLHQYNGYAFTTLLPSPSDTNSIASYWTESFLLDTHGIIWIGTFNAGLNRLDPRTGTFTHYAHNPANPKGISSNVVTALLEENDSILWVGTHNGLNRLNTKTGIFTPYKQEPGNPNSLSNNQVRALYKDKQGTIWIGTGSPFPNETPAGEGGLNRYNRESDSFIRYLHEPGNEQSLVDNKVRAIFEDSRGRFWVGTYGDGLHTMDRQTGTFIRHSYDPSDPGKLSRPVLAGKKPTDDGVSFILEDGTGAIWIGAYKSGLNRYDPGTGRVTHFEQDARNPLSLPSNGVWSAFISQDGVLWIGTTESSVITLDPLRTNISHVSVGKMVSAVQEDAAGGRWIGTSAGLYHQQTGTQDGRNRPAPKKVAGISDHVVTTVFVDKQGTVWVGTDKGGLNEIDPDTKKVTGHQQIPAEPWNKEQGPVYTFFEDREGKIWAGTSKGGWKQIDPDTKQVIHYRHIPAEPGSIGPGPVYNVFEDSRGTIWVASGDILNRFDKKNRTFTRIPIEEPTATRPVIYKIQEDKQGDIWCASSYPGSLYRYNPRTQTLQSFSRNITLTSILTDSAGELWIGTQSTGLFRFDYTAQKLVPFPDPATHENFPVIYNLIEDNQQNLWIGTKNGLYRVDSTRSQSKRFAEDYGINTGILLSNAAHKGPGGRLYFNTSDGYYTFMPQHVQGNPHPPGLLVEEFTLFGKPVMPGEGGPLAEPIHQAKKVVFTHDENVFAFRFGGIHYSNPSENQHQYKLEPYDAGWRTAGPDRTASYHQVPPGKYTLRLKAANSDGLWAERSIDITVKPPWWQTGWAYAGYFLIFASLLYGVRYYTIARERLKANLMLQQLEADKLRELETMRSRFFANISHEFRTPLTLILEPLEQLLASAEEKPNRYLYQLMQRNARRLLELINQLLDLSKLESGKLKLQARPGELTRFLKTLAASFSSLAESRHIAFQDCFPQREYLAWFDQDKLEKIVVNLLSNAFKFTPNGGSIRFAATINPDTASTQASAILEMEVKDSGIGIAQENAEKIFDRFYQVDSSTTRENEGTGIGLSLTKELVDLHQGTISVTSEPGKGTTFTVRLPMRAEEQIIREPEALPEDPDNKLDHLLHQWQGVRHTDNLLGPAAEEKSVQEKPLLLIIEDNHELAGYIASHFSAHFDVLMAADGKQGLQKALATIPDIIISDVMMPQMDGMELCRHLKEDERTSHIPLILLTAKAGEQSKLEGLETGADDYLTKPFSGNELKIRVQNLIASRKRLRERYSRELKLQPAEIAVTSADEKFMERVMAVLEANYAEATFTLDNFEKEAGLSRTQFYRKMKALTDQAPGEFLRNFRLQKAVMLLKGGHGNISEVAYQVGFNSLSYFTRCFKELYGQSPSDYLAAQVTNE